MTAAEKKTWKRKEKLWRQRSLITEQQVWDFLAVRISLDNVSQMSNINIIKDIVQ